MIRSSLKLLVVALVATFALASSVEAAPRKTVRHRAKHSTRVSASPNAGTSTHRTTTRKHTTTRKTTTRKHTSSTKPR